MGKPERKKICWWHSAYWSRWDKGFNYCHTKYGEYHERINSLHLMNIKELEQEIEKLKEENKNLKVFACEKVGSQDYWSMKAIKLQAKLDELPTEEEMLDIAREGWGGEMEHEKLVALIKAIHKAMKE